MTLEEALILSNLTAKAGEEERLRAEMNSIAAFAAALETADGADVEPAPFACPLREDAPRPSFSRGDMLNNAPRVRDGMCVVPRVVD